MRTGVTVIFPHDGDPGTDPVFAGCHRLNGNGELTGLEWVRESGFLTTPIGLTNTHSVGVVRDALIAEAIRRGAVGDDAWSLPVVGETWDGVLNDINGLHVKPEHVFAAIDCCLVRPGRRRQRRERDGDDLPRVQGRDRNGVAPARRVRGRLHGGRARSGELRRPRAVSGRRRGRGGGARAGRDPGRRRGTAPGDRVDHHRRRHRRPACCRISASVSRSERASE